MTEACFDVELADDNVHELQEEFQITARLSGSTTPDATTTVIINDNEGELGVWLSDFLMYLLLSKFSVCVCGENFNIFACG